MRVCKYIEFLSQKTELNHTFLPDPSESLDTTSKSNTVFVDFEIGLLMKGKMKKRKISNLILVSNSNI